MSKTREALIAAKEFENFLEMLIHNMDRTTRDDLLARGRPLFKQLKEALAEPEQEPVAMLSALYAAGCNIDCALVGLGIAETTQFDQISKRKEEVRQAQLGLRSQAEKAWEFLSWRIPMKDTAPQPREWQELSEDEIISAISSDQSYNWPFKQDNNTPKRIAIRISAALRAKNEVKP